MIDQPLNPTEQGYGLSANLADRAVPRCATRHARPCKCSIELGQHVSQRPASIGVEPPPSPMLSCIVDHMAPLTERSEVAGGVVGWIVVEVGARGVDPRHADNRCHAKARCTNPPTTPIAPLSATGVPPASIAQMKHPLAMGALAMFAPAVCATETDQFRQFGPVDRIEPAMFGRDGHHDSMSQPNQERKKKIGGVSIARA